MLKLSVTSKSSIYLPGVSISVDEVCRNQAKLLVNADEDMLVFRGKLLLTPSALEQHKERTREELAMINEMRQRQADLLRKYSFLNN